MQDSVLTMASLTSISAFLIVLFLFFPAPSHGFSLPSPSVVHESVKASEVDTQKVNLSIYYDSMCLPCATFIIANLSRVFDRDLINILNLRMVPWGNGHLNKSNNATVCQHGAEECMLNNLEACSIDVWNDLDKHFGLIHCIEFLAIEGRQEKWQDCFESLGLPMEPVMDCYQSGNGTKLVQKYAEETAHFNPPLAVVPWVVVNGKPIGQDYKMFATYACKAYKGKAIPRACRPSG